MSTITAGVTVPTGLTLTSDTTGGLTFQVSGTVTAATITSAGDVGIGTASPGTKLDAYSSSTTSTILRARNDTTTVYLDANNAYSYLNTFTNHPMLFGTNNTERMRIDSSGNVGIGGTANAWSKLNVTGTYPNSGATAIPVYVDGTLPAAATSQAQIIRTNPTTAAASFTLSNLHHFIAGQQTFGAGSTVTNQYGFNADSSLTGATNNYGFYSNIASAANRWNFYAAGTAANYFAGNVSIGTTPVSSYRFSVYGSGTTSATASAGFWNSTGTSQMYLRDDNYFNSGAINNYSVAGTTVVIDGSNFLGKTTSSLRYKKDIVDYNKGVDAINALRPVYYKSAIEGPNGFDPKQHAGFVAEEIAESGFEEFLIRDSEGRPEAVQYPHMVSLLTKAIQEQQAMIDELKAKVAALETK